MCLDAARLCVFVQVAAQFGAKVLALLCAPIVVFCQRRLVASSEYATPSERLTHAPRRRSLFIFNILHEGSNVALLHFCP